MEAGLALLAGVEEDGVYAAGSLLLHDGETYHRMSHAANPYGDGHAAEKIAAIILEYRRSLPD